MKDVCQSAPTLTGMVPYDPKYMRSEVLLSANESPLDIPASVREAVLERLSTLEFNRYPDPLANQLRASIAEWHGLKAANVLVGNGGDELLYDIFAAWGGPGRALLTFPPTFSVYETNAVLTGTQVIDLPRVGEDWHVDIDKACERLARGDVHIVVLTSPNNPTGMTTPIEGIRRILEATDALVVVDEAYGEFSGQSALPLLAEHDNLLILHTFSKAFRCAGVRLGYILTSPAVITEFKKVRQPYSVDAISQIVGEEVVRQRDAFAAGIEDAIVERERLMTELSAIEKVTVYPSAANFIMFKVPFATRVWEDMNENHSVLVRNVSGEARLAGCLRVTVGTPEENDRFLAALKAELGSIHNQR